MPEINADDLAADDENGIARRGRPQRWKIFLA